MLLPPAWHPGPPCPIAPGGAPLRVRVLQGPPTPSHVSCPGVVVLEAKIAAGPRPQRQVPPDPPRAADSPVVTTAFQPVPRTRGLGRGPCPQPRVPASAGGIRESWGWVGRGVAQPASAGQDGSAVAQWRLPV